MLMETLRDFTHAYAASMALLEGWVIERLRLLARCDLGRFLVGQGWWARYASLRCKILPASNAQNM